jgi:hypothetical protein
MLSRTPILHKTLSLDRKQEPVFLKTQTGILAKIGDFELHIVNFNSDGPRCLRIEDDEGLRTGVAQTNELVLEIPCQASDFGKNEIRRCFARNPDRYVLGLFASKTDAADSLSLTVITATSFVLGVVYSASDESHQVGPLAKTILWLAWLGLLHYNANDIRYNLSKGQDDDNGCA